MIASLVNFLSVWVIPLIIALVVLIALLRRVNVFDVFIEGAKEGFKTSVHLIPFLRWGCWLLSGFSGIQA